MALDTQQIEFFKTQGFLAVPGFFDARETQAMQREIARFQSAGLLRNVSTAGDGTTPSDEKKNLQLCPMYMHSTLFRALPFHPRVLEAVGRLIGNPFLLQLDQVFLKPGGDGIGTSWHQDNAYFQIADPTRGVAMWIAVQDATVANGTLHVVPGSFADALPHERDPNSDHHIRCFPDESRAVPLELPAGGVGFFYYGTPHCTHGNHTDRDRAAAAFHFVHADYAAPDLLEPNRQYHPVLTGPDTTGGEREYGTRVAGTWEQELAKTAH